MNISSEQSQQPNSKPAIKVEPKVYQNNKILKSTLHHLIKNLLSEFKNHTYDSNKILRGALEKLKAQPESEEKSQVLLFWPEIELFIWNMSVSPKYWVMMFENEQFFSAESESIDMHVFTNKIYKYVIVEASRLTAYAEMMGSIISDQLFIFFQEVSVQICQSYQRGREIIMKQTKFMEEHAKKSKIINFYFIYKLLLEISQNCFTQIVEDLQTTIFRNIEHYYAESFADYIIEKHEVLSLIFDSKSEKHSEEEPLIDIIERIKSSNKVKWREAIREDGQSAIIVEFQNQEKTNLPPENYMIKMNKKGKIKVLNCNALRRKWTVTEAAEKNYDILNVVSDKGQIAKKLRNSPTKLKDLVMTDYVSTVGGALGKCLADIKKYDSVGDFVFDLSKKSIISGTFNYIATNIPLIGILFATGGYTYTLFGIFSNKIVNKTKKFQQMGYITFDIASSLGTGLIGAVVGQTLIPIPILGAFVGGFVGSFIGEIGGKAITTKLQSMRFKNIIDKLQATIKPAGYWQVNKQMLKLLGLNRDNFYQTIPQQIEGKLGCDKIWYAMIAFTILSFNESKKRAEFLKMKMELLEKKKQNEKRQISEGQARQELHYEASMDLICVMKYFQNCQVSLFSCFQELQELVTEIFSLMD